MDMNHQAGTPLVSVVMPAYNAAAYIREAMESVIGQTVTDWELIVIDDCSGDESLEIAHEYAKADPRITVMRNECNIGVARTRNRAIECSRGRYIAFLDSDDAWYPEKLQRQIQLLDTTGADMAYCSYAIVGSGSTKVRPDYIVPEKIGFNGLLKENVISCSAMLIKAEIVKEIRFNTDFYHEDYVLGLEILKAGYTAVGCREVLMHWRYIENSRSFNKKKSAKNRWRIYRGYLKLPLFKSLCLFGHYAAAGLKKYRKGKEYG